MMNQRELIRRLVLICLNRKMHGEPVIHFDLTDNVFHGIFVDPIPLSGFQTGGRFVSADELAKHPNMLLEIENAIKHQDKLMQLLSGKP